VPGQLAERDAQRIVRGQVVVPVGDDEQHRQLAQPAAGEPQQVNRRLIGPVNILHHHHVQRPRRTDLPQQRAEQFLPPGSGRAQVQQLAAEMIGEIVERTEGTGGEQAVARSPQPAGAGQLPLKMLQQGRLPDAGLPAESHQSALTAPRLGRVRGQQRQRRSPFQQVHAHIVR